MGNVFIHFTCLAKPPLYILGHNAALFWGFQEQGLLVEALNGVGLNDQRDIDQGYCIHIHIAMFDRKQICRHKYVLWGRENLSVRSIKILTPSPRPLNVLAFDRTTRASVTWKYPPKKEFEAGVPCTIGLIVPSILTDQRWVFLIGVWTFCVH